ncbi:hypothetical protein GCM10023307_23530 [Lysobacter hankyongensis]|uniref:Secreted protein n=1 Tax=Lysobacter hankyongensis TaxID=1176535 RepID=A0ABP9BL42_9GAMM
MNDAALAVLVSVSCGRVTVVFTLPVLPPAQEMGAPEQSGSLTPVGGMTVAVLVMLAAAAAPTVQAIVSVALPPEAMATPVHVPVPVAPEAMVPTVNVPAEGVKLQPVRPAGRLSWMEKVFEARMALGPPLLTVRV